MNEPDVMDARFEVFELSPTGNLERLLARLSVFEDAKAIAQLATSGSRIVMRNGEIVWPKSESAVGGLAIA